MGNFLLRRNHLDIEGEASLTGTINAWTAILKIFENNVIKKPGGFLDRDNSSVIQTVLL
jgi:hypothetical protein